MFWSGQKDAATRRELIYHVEVDQEYKRTFVPAMKASNPINCSYTYQAINGTAERLVKIQSNIENTISQCDFLLNKIRSDSDSNRTKRKNLTDESAICSK